ncbi:MAG: polysaccharide pyruvyl transferase family protein [Pseudomonadota bacterium]
MINILIPEDIPSANKGEAALFFGIAKSLTIFKDSRIHLFSMNPEEDGRAYGGHAEIVDARGLVPAHLLDGNGSFLHKLINYFKFIGKCASFGLMYRLAGPWCRSCVKHAAWRRGMAADIVLMCHDSFYAPLYHGPMMMLFKMLKKPVMLYGSSIMPPDLSGSWVETRARDAFNRFILNKADWITLRERHSYHYVRFLGVTRADVYPDLAFIVDTASDAEIDSIFEEEGIPEHAPLCGFAFSQKELDFAHPNLPLPQRKETAIEAIVAMMNHLTGVLGIHAVFIPHAIGPTARVDDRIAADWIRDRCANNDMIHIIRNDYGQRQLKGMASRLDLTVGTRLHFTIDAVCHHVPSMLITHRGEFRCHGIIGEMLGQARFVYNIETLSPDDLIELVTALWENRFEVREDLSRRLPAIVDSTAGHAARVRRILKQHSEGAA